MTWLNSIIDEHKVLYYVLYCKRPMYNSDWDMRYIWKNIMCSKLEVIKKKVLRKIKINLTIVNIYPLISVWNKIIKICKFHNTIINSIRIFKKTFKDNFFFEFLIL